MRIFFRVLAVLVAVLAAAVALPDAARATTDESCSTAHYTPSVTVSFEYCGDHTNHTWASVVMLQNDTKSPYTIYTQLKLQIDGKVRPMLAPRKTKLAAYQAKYWDPYHGKNAPNGVGFVAHCTPGHTYLPIVRVKVSGKKYSGWVKGHKFKC